MSQAPVGQRSAHRPQCRQTSSSLTMTRPVLSPFCDIEVLGEIVRRRGQPRAQLGFLAVRREGDAVHRADVDAGVAFDAELRRKHRLHVAIQAAAGFLERELDVEAELDFRLDVFQRHGFVAQRHLVALIELDLVVVGPFVDAHLLAHQLDRRQRAVGDVLAIEHLVDRDGGLVAMRHRPDDIFRAERGVAAEKDFRVGRGKRHSVDLGHIPFVELMPQSRSIQGKAFSWPTATSTSSQGKC